MQNKRYPGFKEKITTEVKLFLLRTHNCALKKSMAQKGGMPGNPALEKEYSQKKGSLHQLWF
jgi:hypothetical protein